MNAYLTFKGDCRQAFEFYERVLGGKLDAMLPHAGSPAEEHTPPEWRDKIMHAHLTAGEGVIMGSDAPPQHYRQPQGITVSLDVKETSEAERIFKELSEGGFVTMPLEKTFWASRFGMCTDRFGIPWMVNCV